MCPETLELSEDREGNWGEYGMNRYVLGAVLAVLAYVGASSGQQFVSQLMDNSDTNAQLSDGVSNEALTPVQRLGQNAQRESDETPVVSSENFGAPVEEAPQTSPVPNPTAVSPDTTGGSIGDFPPAQSQTVDPTTVPVDNSIPALW